MPVPGPAPVKVASVLVADLPYYVEHVGQTEATANVDVRSRVEGIVESIHFSEGSLVTKDDLLFKIEKDQIEQRLARARANLADAEARLAKTQQDVSRYEPLVQQRAIPRQDLENAQSSEKQAQANLEASRADLARAELDLKYADVTAPISGLIGAKQVDIGSLVGSMPATLLATISPIDPIWAVATLSEIDFLRAKRATMDGRIISPLAYLVLSDGTLYSRKGKFNFLDSKVDPGTGTIRIRAEFPNPDGLLRPGQFVRVRNRLRDIENAVLIPQRAVQEVQGVRNVWVMGPDNKVSYRKIEVDMAVGNLWMVKSGLVAGEKIVVDGLLRMREGVEVAAEETTINRDPITALDALAPKDEP